MTDVQSVVDWLMGGTHADEALANAKGISDTEEPDLWQMDLTGAIQLWIEVGQPDERRILKAAGRSDKVMVYSYSSASHVWWKQIASKIDRAKNVSVVNIDADASAALEKMAQRSMQLQCTIQDGQIYLTDSVETVLIERETTKP